MTINKDETIEALDNLFKALGGDVKSLSGKIGALSDLNTDETANLVGAINEVLTTAGLSEAQVDARIASQITSLKGGDLPEALDTVIEIATQIGANEGAITTLQTIASKVVRFDAQTLTAAQKEQARTNINAASQSDMTSVNAILTKDYLSVYKNARDA